MKKNYSKTKKFRKPLILKKSLGRNYGGACGTCTGCGSLVIYY